jgi:hypothetical protein
MITATAMVLLGLSAANTTISTALDSPHQSEAAEFGIFVIKSAAIAFQSSSPVIKVAQTDDAPTASDANEYLSKLFNAGGIIVSTRVDNDHYMRHKVRSYTVDTRCTSTAMAFGGVAPNPYGIRLDIDWSNISSAHLFEHYKNAIRISGAIRVAVGSDDHMKTSTELHFDEIDDVTARRMSKAVDLLAKSCSKASKFD